MAATISTRNEESQGQIFPVEIVPVGQPVLPSAMEKIGPEDSPEIYLGDWLEFFEIGPTEAAKIAGCKQSYISNISGGRKPNVNVLYLLRLSEHMGVTVNDFYRRLPSKTHLNTLKNLSPKAQASILKRQAGER